jgi:nitrate reductase alpha subunit
MIEDMGGAGTRTIKMRGGMGLLGVLGKYGMYRLCNSLALLDVHVRGVKPEDAKAGRIWSNYTWHGDQAPGHPWVHGLQNRRRLQRPPQFQADHHERQKPRREQDGRRPLVRRAMERGCKIVVIAPEYGAPSTKADYWIPIRPATDAALWLGVTRLMMDNKWYDETFVKQFTDFPLLVRTDNGKRLRAAEVFPNYASTLAADGPSKKVQGITDEQHAKLGDFVVWDAKAEFPKAAHARHGRRDAGQERHRAALDWKGKVKLATARGRGRDARGISTRFTCRTTTSTASPRSRQRPKELIERLAKDIATIKPCSIHQGEGINHWFHATEANRAAYLPLMLTGNIGKPGAGCHGWAGNYKAALFQGSKLTGPGFKGWVMEDPFEQNLDPKAHGRDVMRTPTPRTRNRPTGTTATGR